MSISSTCAEPTAPTVATFTTAPVPPRAAASRDEPDDPDGSNIDIDGWEGWQALAVATLGRPFTDAEQAAVRALAPEHVLDLLFPDLTAEARHEALWALG
jgi:hypothetical protein